MSSVLKSWPLAGREEELGFIEQRLGSPDGAGIVLAGSAGVGKTRLAREAIALAGARGFMVEWITGTHSAASIPFGALAHLLPTDAMAAERVELFGLTAQALEGRAGGRPLLIAVDDAHVLDGSSAAFVAYMAQTGRAFVVLVLRTGEAAPDAIVNIWKDGAAPRVELQPLSRNEIVRLLEEVLGGQLDGGAARRLWEATRGNALYLRELVHAAVEAEQLVAAGGVWRWRGELPGAPRLAELLGQRLAGVGAGEREVLETVAIGEPVPVAVLESILSASAVAAAGRAGLLDFRETGGRPQVKLVHPLYGELLRAGVSPVVARDLQRRLADGLDAVGPDSPDELLRLATWRVDSGSPVRPDVLMAAAERALALFDFALALRLGRAAVDAGGGVPAGALLAQASIGTGEFRAADRILRDLEPRCADEAERLRIVITRAQNLFWRILDQPAARALVDEAATTAKSIAGRREAASARAMFQLFEGDPDSAIDTAEDVLAAGGRLAVEAAMTLSWAFVVVGRFDRSLAVVRAALEELERGADVPFARDWLVKTASAADHFAGRLDRGAEVARDAYAAATDRGADLGRAMHAFARGWVDLSAGRVADAARHQREAAAVFREVNIFGHLPGALGELARAEALRGNLAAAEAALAEAESNRTNRMDEIMVGLGRTWTLAAGGELSRARDEALRTAAATASLGQRTFEAYALHDALRLGDRSVAPRLATLAGDIEGVLVGTMAVHAKAEADEDAAALVAASRSFEEIGARLLAAEAAAGASRCHAADGRQASARAAAARALALAEGLGVMRTPLLSDVAGAPRLTQREREIAALAASQLSSREIADRLVVSVRTVDNHLRNVYLKLGVGGRDELAPVLGRARIE